MNNVYDFIVIGAGISACTFASFLNKRLPDASILLVEHGRRLGGRSTTRRSRKRKTLEFDHGLPSISFSQHVSEELETLITPLINSSKLVDITNDILTINEIGEIDKVVTNFRIYRGMPFMVNFCEEIINQSTNRKKINFLFQTLTKSIKRIHNLWVVTVNKEKFFKAKNLILSSSLIAHPRCLEILQVNSLPLRDAVVPGKDNVIDSILIQTSKQTYLKRRVYILHVQNDAVVKNFDYKYLQIIFTKVIKDDFNFERLIFQRQLDGSMIIALHCSYIYKFSQINQDQIIKSLITIFVNHNIFTDLFLQARLIDRMDWRASQPLNNFIPKELQWSPISNIGFCGDWFEYENCRGVESAINSSIRLAKLLA